mgnify:CR=1 FL=1
MKHQYRQPYTPFFNSDKYNESFIKGSVQIALEKACKIIGRRCSSFTAGDLVTVTGFKYRVWKEVKQNLKKLLDK